jgi:hypothetical protein
MLRMYCQEHHGSAGKQLCQDCQQLREYAEQRLQKCPFGAEKGPCSQCEVHCYKPSMRERIQNVMRYSGPRMPDDIVVTLWSSWMYMILRIVLSPLLKSSNILPHWPIPRILLVKCRHLGYSRKIKYRQLCRN